MSRVGLYLAFKEMWRGKGRFFLISLVIALITVLVLFVAALGEGLGAGNREYIEKLNADLIVYKKNVELSISASRIDRPKRNDVRRVAGVDEVGQISFSNVSVVLPGDAKPVNISIIGVEPGKPGEPPVLAGRGLTDLSAREAIIDRNVAYRTGLNVGNEITVKSIQGTKDEYYTLKIVGLTDSRQFFLQPSIIVPHQTWERIKPGQADPQPQMVSNLVAVRLQNPADLETVRARLEDQVSDIQVVDRVTAYEATPGYSAQQGTLNAQRGFALVIGVLVIGGFFQIQMLQKVPQVGMLKAVGASSHTIGIAVVTQILGVTLLGVSIGTLGTLALSLSFPPTIPIVFTGSAVALAVASLLMIGPLGGMVSVRYALQVEPLMALGLSA